MVSLLSVFKTWHYAVEGQENACVGESKHEKLDVERKHVAEPSAGKIEAEQPPQRSLHRKAERAPRFGAELLIPYAPE